MGGNPQRPTIVPASERSVQTIVVIQWVGMVYTKKTYGVAEKAMIGLDLRLGLKPRKFEREHTPGCATKPKVSHG